MCRTQSVLALVALCVGLAHSWDIAVSLKNQLVFYTNGTKTDTVNLISQKPTLLAHDEIRNRVLYVDKQNRDDAICGYDISTKENKCFVKRNGRDIQGLAFDPVTELVFFTDAKERSINWISLKHGAQNNVYGNHLFTMDNHRIPTDIAVDSCQGYIYWINNNSNTFERMGKARFNGSNIEDVFIRDDYYPSLFTIDPQLGKMYYLDGCETCPPDFLNIADFDGQNEIVIQALHEAVSKLMTISKSHVYWVDNNTVWQTPKNSSRLTPEKYSEFYSNEILGLVANYKINDQIWAPQDCEALSSLTVPNHSLNILQIKQNQPTTVTENITKVEQFCVHGIKDESEVSACKCKPGYMGARCDVSICENYCLQGNCSFNDEGLPTCSCNGGYSGERCEVYACRGYCIHGDCSFNNEGLPTCRCNTGYSGDRCEVSACHGYCLNNGDCSLNEEDEPVCKCVGNHEGSRCEAVNGTYPSTKISMYDSVKGNLTLADLLSSWRAPNSKLYVTINNYFYNLFN